MAALTVDTVRSSRNRGLYSGVGSATSVYFAGAFVGVDTVDGLVKEWADTATFRWLGVVTRKADTNVTDPITPEVNVNISGIILEKVSVTGVTAQANVGDLVFATTDNDLTLTASTNVKAIGKVDRFESGTTVDVALFTPTEYEGLL